MKSLENVLCQIWICLMQWLYPVINMYGNLFTEIIRGTQKIIHMNVLLNTVYNYKTKKWKLNIDQNGVIKIWWYIHMTYHIFQRCMCMKLTTRLLIRFCYNINLDSVHWEEMLFPPPHFWKSNSTLLQLEIIFLI